MILYLERESNYMEGELEIDGTSEGLSDVRDGTEERVGVSEGFWEVTDSIDGTTDTLGIVVGESEGASD